MERFRSRFTAGLVAALVAVAAVPAVPGQETARPVRYVVMGDVAKPAVFSASPEQRRSLSDVIDQAGGLRAGQSSVTVVRNGKTVWNTYLTPGARRDWLLEPGDVVAVHAVSALLKPTPQEPAPATKADRPIQVALLNVVNRPVIVTLPPDASQFGSVLERLGASSQPQVRLVRTAPRQASPLELTGDDQLMHGDVLIFRSRPVAGSAAANTSVAARARATTPPAAQTSQNVIQASARRPASEPGRIVLTSGVQPLATQDGAPAAGDNEPAPFIMDLDEPYEETPEAQPVVNVPSLTSAADDIELVIPAPQTTPSPATSPAGRPQITRPPVVDAQPALAGAAGTVGQPEIRTASTAAGLTAQTAVLTNRTLVNSADAPPQAAVASYGDEGIEGLDGGVQPVGNTQLNDPAWAAADTDAVSPFGLGQPFTMPAKPQAESSTPGVVPAPPAPAPLNPGQISLVPDANELPQAGEATSNATMWYVAGLAAAFFVVIGCWIYGTRLLNEQRATSQPARGQKSAASKRPTVPVSRQTSRSTGHTRPTPDTPPRVERTSPISTARPANPKPSPATVSASDGTRDHDAGEPGVAGPETPDTIPMSNMAAPPATASRPAGPAAQDTADDTKKPQVTTDPQEVVSRSFRTDTPSVSVLESLIQNDVPARAEAVRLPVHLELYGDPAGPRLLRIDPAETQLKGPHFGTRAPASPDAVKQKAATADASGTYKLKTSAQTTAQDLLDQVQHSLRKLDES